MNFKNVLLHFGGIAALKWCCQRRPRLWNNLISTAADGGMCMYGVSLTDLCRRFIS
jgi:hypothetical protein